MHTVPRITVAQFEALRALIYRETGISLSDAKRQLVESRLARRLRALELDDYGEYHDLLRREGSDAERRELVNCITTNKTSFFREPHHFTYLRDIVFPALSAGRRLRIWSAGCSTGEEPYTIAITALEHFGADAARRVQILATDIDTEVLARAERAVYDERTLGDLPPHVRHNWFLRGTGRSTGLARVRPEARALVEFRQLNLMSPAWPLEDDLDVVFCRNVIIYFDAPTRLRLIERFVERLRPGGHLMLGHSEIVPPEVTSLESLRNTTFRKAGRADADTGRAASAPRLAQARVDAGDVFASAEPAVARTLLGSCVAACLYDPVARVGGMNHFMLPAASADTEVTTRYGVHAMEVLINEIMRRGGDRRRLEAKVFGAASVLRLSTGAADVATLNARFIREFLAAEDIPLRAHRLGGTHALDVIFHTGDGRARVRALAGDEARQAVEHDARHLLDVGRSISVGTAGDVTLF
ncbi:MAG TPA: CheR family methyltransferase [Gemmatimonadaceae bacterium]|nr:CheR family methyltransferase [Gemmatimonadaceae bacterium]